MNLLNFKQPSENKQKIHRQKHIEKAMEPKKPEDRGHTNGARTPRSPAKLSQAEFERMNRFSTLL
jgi:hypothetical protein